MEGGMKCIKFLLFAFNLLFAVSGIAIIITGALIQAKYTKYLDFLGNNFLSTPVLLIVVGCIIFVVAFFGCCGASKENHCMVITFSVLLGIIFVLELAAGIAAYILQDEVRGIISTNMKESMKNYNKTGYEGVTKTWNIVQHELHCCGVHNSSDWKNTSFADITHGVPDDCCKEVTKGCGMNKDMEKYLDGCLDKFEIYVKNNVAIVGGVGVGIAFIQLLGIIFACCLGKSIRKNYETV